MSEPTYVWQLEAEFLDPMCGDGMRVMVSSTVFTSSDRAKARSEKFRDLIRSRFKTRDDYPIKVDVKPLEIVE